MNWENAIVKGISRDQDGNVTQLTGVLLLERFIRTTKLKLTWLPEINELVNLTLVRFDYLIMNKKVHFYTDDQNSPSAYYFSML